jgi:hypothetical protein
MKKTGPRRARFRIAGVGSGNFQRGTCCFAGLLWEDTSDATAWLDYIRSSARSNPVGRMSAMPNRKLAKYIATIAPIFSQAKSADGDARRSFQYV